MNNTDKIYGYCNKCGRRTEIRMNNYDSWFNLLWCCPEHKVAPTSKNNKYDISTGKRR